MKLRLNKQTLSQMPTPCANFMSEPTKLKGYKGFNQDWTCKGVQFEVGKTYEHTGEVKLCTSGYHFCENPLDIFAYYPPTGKFAEIDADGVSDQKEDDSKRVCRSLTIKSEIKLSVLLKLGVEFILSKVDFTKAPATNTGDRSAATNTGDQSAATNTGDRSAATNTGDYSAATNTGDRSAATNTGNQSAATNTGDRSAATVEGKESIAVVTGKESKAAGTIGCWIVLTERDADWNILEVKAFKVDGKKIEAGAFYQLKDGKAVKE